MLDEEKACRCPYCNTVYDRSFGYYTFYEYKDRKRVIIENHGCGDFICEPSNNTLYNVLSRYHWSGFSPVMRNDIIKVILDNLKRIKNEDELYDIVLETLKPFYADDFIKRNPDIKAIIEMVLSWATTPLWSEPLTKEIKEELEKGNITNILM